MPPAKGSKYKARRHPELVEMEAVEKQPKEEDTEHQAKLRAWYDSDIKSWKARKDRLDGRGRGADPEPPGNARETPGVDRGANQAREDLRAWLERNKE